MDALRYEQLMQEIRDVLFEPTSPAEDKLLDCCVTLKEIVLEQRDTIETLESKIEALECRVIGVESKNMKF